MPTTKRSQTKILKDRGRVDIKQVRSATDKDIARWIAEDPDTAPELPRRAKLRLIHNPPLPDVKSIRKKLGLTQAEFARHFGLSRRTIEQWEQDRAVPDRPARILLAVIDREHRVVEQVVKGGVSVAKTLLDIEERLLEDARRLAKVRTKREAVEVALREYVRRHRTGSLMAAAGKSSIRWTPADIRAMRQGK